MVHNNPHISSAEANLPAAVEPERIASEAAEQIVAALHETDEEQRGEILDVVSDKLGAEGLLLVDAGKVDEADERRGSRTGLTREQLLARMALDRVVQKTFKLPSARRHGVIKTRLI